MKARSRKCNLIIGICRLLRLPLLLNELGLLSGHSLLNLPQALCLCLHVCRHSLILLGQLAQPVLEGPDLGLQLQDPLSMLAQLLCLCRASTASGRAVHSALQKSLAHMPLLDS